MKESAWETSRRSARKKTVLLGLIVIPVVAVAVVIVVNNRELISHSGRRHAGPAKLKPFPASKNSHAADAKDSGFSFPSEALLPETTSPGPKACHSPASTASQPAEETSRQPGNNPSDREKQAAAETSKSFSITLPSIPCMLENRKDVVIFLSLELFFSEIEKRADILFRREDIKIVVMRAVHKKEFAEMKIIELERELLHDLNRLFKYPGITAVKIRNIQVEKAVK